MKLVEREEALEKFNISEWEGWELAQQEYEALYLVPEGVSAKELLEDFYSSALQGYYDVKKDEIVVVKGAEGSLDKSVLAHELTHALTDQYYPEIYELDYELTDKDFAVSALVEGDAELVEELFSKGGYDCELNLDAAPASVPLAIIYLQIFPYLEGYNFVRKLREEGGWAAVNQAYVNPPQSTEQIIHPDKYPWEKPLEVRVKGSGYRGWKPLGEDILGEASIFMMFWNQGLARFSLTPWGEVTYRSPLSEGWGGDHMVVYKKGEGEYGYVWLLAWDTVEDALEFKEGYEQMLTILNAKFQDGAWKVGNDYVTVELEGKTVVIVNAPSKFELDDVRLAGGLPVIKIEDFRLIEGGIHRRLSATLKNLTPEDQESLIIIQVKDAAGHVQDLYYVYGSIPAGARFNIQTPWKAWKGETLYAEIYVWRSFKEPTPLTPPQTLATGG
ncbi:MAG: hypothetical protein DRO46_04470 [Candidatus Hecatellales archaeon]|nr:MAG: hypothetical protein DRO46_04470 [Candidatus Hecatellales archaeon]